METIVIHSKANKCSLELTEKAIIMRWDGKSALSKAIRLDHIHSVEVKEPKGMKAGYLCIHTESAAKPLVNVVRDSTADEQIVIFDNMDDYQKALQVQNYFISY